ncbi:MAG: 4-(cytidine 5'-diphospho)-2-C-methyl-D-erythritol kinase [Caldisericaceae bacterium]
MIEYANAKLNLTLEITGKTEDAYHQIASVFQKIKLSDRVSIENAFIDEVSFNRKVFSKITTVHIARDIFREATSIIEPVNISVKKSIPVGSGLGGGSSDARATLFLLNRLFGNPLSDASLIQLGKRIGSDVPFFFNGSTAFVSGVGDTVEPIQNLNKIYIIIIFPVFHSPTRLAYELFDKFGSFSNGTYTDKFISALSTDYNASMLNDLAYNDFELLFKKIDSRYRKLFDFVEHFTSTKFHLTGSGSSFFSLFDKLEQAKYISKKLQKAGLRHVLTETI